MSEIPTSQLYFFAFWWAMIGGGVLMLRVIVAERLRLLNGGLVSDRLRVGRRIVDVCAVGILLVAVFWLIAGLVRTAAGS